MIKLDRNRSLPTPTSHGAPLRKITTNVFSFPTLNLTRTSSERSSVGEPMSRSSSKSRSRSRTRSSGPILLAPIINAIHKGNFVMLSEMDLDVLLEDMAGKDSKTLETIFVTASSISASDAKIIAKLIKSSHAANIKSLKLEGNTISQQATKLMFEAWKFNKSITTLSLARSGIDDKTIKYLSKVLPKNETLRSLDLSGNHISSQGVDMLAQAMIENRGVTRLCLQSNNIKKAGAPHLAKILAKNRVLRHLNIGSNSLGADGVTLIAEAVRFNRTLYSLSLDMNEMGSKGASAIATALVSNRHLTHLYIPHNNIRDKGLEDICESLKRNKCLAYLDLELNHIGLGQSTSGLKALGDILKINTTLREINLSFNLFSAQAIEGLANGMAMNTTLESVIFTNCGLSTEAAVALAKALPTASGLQNLGLTNNNDIGVDGYWALATSLIRNRSLKGVQLDYNSEDRQALYESFQNSLTRNHIWQQAIYDAACRILILSRVVLLGRPANQKQLLSQQQHHVQQHNQHHGWNIFRRVRLGRSNSSNSVVSVKSIGKNSLNGGHGSQSNGTEDASSESNHGSSHIRQISLSGILPNKIVPRQLSNSSLLTNSRHGAQTSISTVNTACEPHQQQPNGHNYTQSNASTVVEIEYDPHKILANLVNMPHEIFENVCAFLDPGRTMNIAQIRATVQAAGDRKTLVKDYTREKMLERIFNSRYISPHGTRYSVKPGDERV